MRLRCRAVIILFVLLLARSAFCDGTGKARSLFYLGNTNYSDEKYEPAVNNYEEALRLGFASGPLYYNLGNAYFKDGQLGRAILNYSRAARIMPRDADLKANMDYALSRIKGGMTIPRRNLAERVLQRSASSFSLDELTLFSALLYSALSIIIILGIVFANTRKVCVYLGVPVLVLSIAGLALFYVQFDRTVIRKEAVVVGPSADARFEPIETATTFFTLNEGETITVISSKGEWIKVKRPDGKQGWIKGSGVEKL